MYKYFKIVCNSVLRNRLLQRRLGERIIGISVLRCDSSLRLCRINPFKNKSDFKLPPPSNLAIALSILTWLGFTKEDEEKESELITILKRAVLCTQREQYDKAEQMLHLALRIAQQQQNEQGVIYCYDLMANLAFDQYELDKAEKLFVSVMQMLLGHGTSQDDLKVRNFYGISELIQLS